VQVTLILLVSLTITCAHGPKVLLAGEAEGSDEDCQQEDMDSDLADADKAHSKAGTGMLDEQSDQEMQTGNTHQHHDKTADEDAQHGQTKKRRAVLYESDDE